MEKITLNKNGKPRKKGSGKTMGAGCYSKISWRELKKFVGADVAIPVSRVWLRQLGVDARESIEGIPPTADTASAEKENLRQIEKVSTGAADSALPSTQSISTTDPALEPTNEKSVLKDESEGEIPSKDQDPEERDSEEEQNYRLPEDSLAATAYRYSQNFDL